MTGVPTVPNIWPTHLASAGLPLGSAGPALGSAGAAVAPLLPSILILLLCVLAAAATVLLLPGRAEKGVRKVGGAVLAATGLVFAATLYRAAAGQGANVYFWPFAAVAVASAVRVVTHPRPVYAALYFVLTTFASAGLFVLLWAEFMAAALILIYAGAILVTYVFVIMLAQQSSTGGKGASADLPEYDAVSREPVVAAAIGFSLMALLIFVISDKAVAITPVPEVGPAAALDKSGEFTQAVGRHLFEHHLMNLELAGLILTLATVGAIVIARRKVAVGGVPGGVPIVPEVLTSPATPIDDDPHSIPVYGTDNPRQKAYPET